MAWCGCRQRIEARTSLLVVVLWCHLSSLPDDFLGILRRVFRGLHRVSAGVPVPLLKAGSYTRRSLASGLCIALDERRGCTTLYVPLTMITITCLIWVNRDEQRGELETKIKFGERDAQLISPDVLWFVQVVFPVLQDVPQPYKDLGEKQDALYPDSVP